MKVTRASKLGKKRKITGKNITTAQTTLPAVNVEQSVEGDMDCGEMPVQDQDQLRLSSIFERSVEGKNLGDIMNPLDGADSGKQQPRSTQPTSRQMFQ